MIAYIIFMNDDPMNVVLGNSKKAEKILKILADRNYANTQTLHISREQYDIEYYWHIHEVGVVN